MNPIMEITEIGLLGLAALAVGLLAGGQVVGSGFLLSAQLPLQPGPASLYLTPVAVVRVSDGPLHDRWWAHGLTLGGTVVYGDPNPPHLGLPRPGLEEMRREIERYELGHLEGWAHYGLEYMLRVLAEPCVYDPKAGWATHCPNDRRPPLLLPPRTGAFRLVIP